MYSARDPSGLKSLGMKSKSGICFKLRHYRFYSYVTSPDSQVSQMWRDLGTRYLEITSSRLLTFWLLCL